MRVQVRRKTIVIPNFRDGPSDEVGLSTLIGMVTNR